MERILGLDLDLLTRRTSMKWRRYPADVLPLWVAEMDTPMPPGVRRVWDEIAQLGDTGYPAGEVYAEAFTSFAADTWGWTIEPAQFCLSPDVMQGIGLLIEHLLADGPTGVVINPPVYPPFFAAVRGSGGELVEIALTEAGRLDLPAIVAAYADPRVRLHLLSNPHNPTGVVHTADELRILADAAAEHGVTIIADEIHAPLAPPADFVPMLTVDPGAISVLSASKAWNLAGLKAALLIAGPQQVPLLGTLPYERTRGASSHVAIRTHAAALTEDRGWLDQLRSELAANRTLLADLLATHLPQVGHRTAPGTYLAWLDCSALGLEHPQRHFVDRARVALNDGADFGAGNDQWVRLNLATSPEILTRAVEQLAASLPDASVPQ